MWVFFRRNSDTAGGNIERNAAGRGQAIAPTMLTFNQPAKGVHSRGDGLSSPWGVAESHIRQQYQIPG